MKRLSLTQIVLIASLMLHGINLMGKIFPYNQPAFASSEHSGVTVKSNCQDGNTGGTK
jgi:hypothetical protein